MTSPQQASAYLDRIAELEADNDRLRKKVEWFTHAVHTCHDECDRPLCAALRENNRLRAALEWIAGCSLSLPQAMADKARAALEGK